MLQPAPRSTRRPWSSLAISSAAHVGLIALAVLLSRRPSPEAPKAGDDAAARERQIETVYLPPPAEPPPPRPEPPPEPRTTPPPTPPPAQPAPVPRPFNPPSPREQRAPEPDANAPPDAPRVDGQGEPDAGGGAPAPEAATMESEAQRIFGRKRATTPPGAGPRAVRPMEAVVPEDPTKCVPRPAEPRDSSAPVEYGVAEGRILRGDNGRPLAGAHLQMLGTPYTAFTDGEGGYRFRFDLSLVDQCRTQYVRVEAKGFESRLLVLVVGRSVRSEDVSLNKRSWWR